MIEMKDVDEKDYVALEKLYYDIQQKKFIWEKESVAS